MTAIMFAKLRCPCAAAWRNCALTSGDKRDAPNASQRINGIWLPEGV
jgi:hypothetical protein